MGTAKLRTKRLNNHLFGRSEIADGIAYHFSINGFASPLKRAGVLAPGKYRVTIEARTPNGQVFIPVEFEYVAE